MGAIARFHGRESCGTEGVSCLTYSVELGQLLRTINFCKKKFSEVILFERSRTIYTIISSAQLEGEVIYLVMFYMISGRCMDSVRVK